MKIPPTVAKTAFMAAAVALLTIVSLGGVAGKGGEGKQATLRLGAEIAADLKIARSMSTQTNWKRNSLDVQRRLDLGSSAAKAAAKSASVYSSATSDLALADGGTRLSTAPVPARELQVFSQTFAVFWLTKLTNVIDRTTPALIARCGSEGTIELVATSHSDVTCTKSSAEMLECTTGDSVFSSSDLLKSSLSKGNGVNATFTCSGPSETAILAQLEIAEQNFEVNVDGIYPDENIVRGFSQPQLRAHQICDDTLGEGTPWCSPEADGLFGYCLSSEFCNAVCFGVGCFDSCSLTVPKVTTGFDAVSCKSTSAPELVCETLTSSPTFTLQAEEATNLVAQGAPFVARRDMLPTY